MDSESPVTRLLRALRGELPEVILGRIFEGDPLGLQDRVMRVLRGNGFLLDPDRCLQHSLEEIAFVLAGASVRDAEDLDGVWIERCVERACDRILAQDIETERLWNLGITVEQGTHRFLSEAFGVTWGQGRAASVSFHALVLRTRLTFFAVCVDCLPAHQWCTQAGASAQEVRNDVWDAFCALGYVAHGEVAEFRARG